ncbi:type II toxin-antitoxin system VapC family toxin [Thiothrix subterranea]|uniref:type II toxin-antitoxin system VapC family toxin n=1 Tax=Thiothrix subterranea TaxID=2735563 RepID=UPI00192C7554|nr:type II toxin-antitoxin system VapC family toxin [Thiothrix subterranea]QQZ30563.1 type II toxin-antitoxin system VapC family toxin [Thiothrix subterranea]
MAEWTLVDTDILIDAAHKDEMAVTVLQNLESTSGLAVSIVTQMELVVGCRNKTEQRELAKFLQRFQVIHLSASISQRGLELLQQYRLSHGLLIPDGLIAATAIEAGIPLISKNQKDYRFIDGLQLLPYPP